MGKMCQEDFKNLGEKRFIRVQNHPYIPRIIEEKNTFGTSEYDMTVEYVSNIGKFTFTESLNETCQNMLKKKYGGTLGEGKLLSTYSNPVQDEYVKNSIEKAIVSYQEEAKIKYQEKEMNEGESKKGGGNKGAEAGE